MTQLQTDARTEITRFENATQLMSLGLSVIDSVVELTPRDTIRRVRYIHVSKSSVTSYDAVASQADTETAAATVEEISISPIAAESIKSGVTGLRPRCRMAILLVFCIFSLIFVLFVKFFLPLHR